VFRHSRQRCGLFLSFGRRHACGSEFYDDLYFWCSDQRQVGTHYRRGMHRDNSSTGTFKLFFSIISMVAGRMFQHSCPCHHRASVDQVYDPTAFLSECERESAKPDHPFWPFCFCQVSLLIQSVEKTVLSPLKPRLILRILTHACTSRLSMAKGEHGGF